MGGERENLRPRRGGDRLGRRLAVKDELLPALLPTGTGPTVLALLEVFSDQRLRFASLALLIYLAPRRTTFPARVIAPLPAASPVPTTTTPPNAFPPIPYRWGTKQMIRG